MGEGRNESYYLMVTVSVWGDEKVLEKIVAMVGLPWWSSGKESALECRGHVFDPWSGN